MNTTIRQITLVLSAALLLVACKKDKNLQYPWSINFNDGTNNYQFVGNSTKQVRDGDRAVFGAWAGYGGRLPNGKLVMFTAQTNFDTYNGNPQRMGLGIQFINWDTAFLQRIDPANSSNNPAARLAALQQWLGSKTFILSPSPTTDELRFYYKDIAGLEWQGDFTTTGEVRVTDIAPFAMSGYSQCLRANVKFTINLVRYGNTLPLTVLGRQTISGNMVGFFTLDE